jgi:phospholipid transport system substrate-binding protein
MTLFLNRRKFALHFLGLASVLTVASPAFASVAAEAYVKRLGAEVIQLANGGRRGDKALQRRFAALFNRYINIPAVANFALGPQQRYLPGADKAMFYDLVANYAAALFVWYVDDFKGSELEVTSSISSGKFTEVSSAIRGSGIGGEKLRWRVGGADGNLRVADLNVKGVWLTISMKKLFADTLKNSNGDFKALYAKLREAETW